MKRKTVIALSLGNCVHIAGIQGFLKMCEEEGCATFFLGPAVSPEATVKAIKKYQPDLVAISYRLTPEVAENLFDKLIMLTENRKQAGPAFIFGGTPAVARAAESSGLFEKVFNGTESLESVRAYIRGLELTIEDENYPQDLIDRIEKCYPYPLIRHHFGRPSLEETVRGAELIADAAVIDVLSIGPDQNAQESFFRPHEMKSANDGAGGMPLRKTRHTCRVK